VTIAFERPLLGFCAYSGTGKTTLLAQVIPLLRQQGLRLALLKHAHHAFDLDQPGKDSHTLRKAGADQVMVASSRRVALVRERPARAGEPELGELLPCLDPRGLDLVLVEGFKRAPIPKIELHRPALGRPLIHARDPHVIAVATDAPLIPARPLPLLDLNRPAAIARFVLERLAKQAGLAAAG
jgi:molybdopterin-guanine dinucleotide biosynthesis protein B